MKLLDKAKTIATSGTEQAVGMVKNATSVTLSRTQELTEKALDNDAVSSIRAWIVQLVVKAVEATTDEQDRMDTLAWLSLAREVLMHEELSVAEKAKALFKLTDSKRVVQAIMRTVSTAVENYKNADIPLALKVAIPITLGASAIVGGHGVGIVGFGMGIGAPVLLLIFLGVAGITSVLEAFLTRSEARDYISVVAVMIARDEMLRRTNHAMREAMANDIVPPQRQQWSVEEGELRALLLTMEPYDFERHVMSFFQQAGMLAWVTKRSNDAGVDGFARHPNGVIVVQCKRNMSDNKVGRPTVQQFKGVVEEHEAWRGYIVTTSSFTNEASESAAKNEKVVLIGMDELVAWHTTGFQV